MPQPPQARTHSRTITGLIELRPVISNILDWSGWFAVMPLPDDQYEIAVREENADRLNRLVDAV
jgi:hypothetical protein